MQNEELQVVESTGYIVFDADHKEKVAVSAEMLTKAQMAVADMSVAEVVMANNIKRLHDDRLYLCFHDESGRPYHSWKGFCDGWLYNRFGKSYSQIQRYFRISDYFSNYTSENAFSIRAGAKNEIPGGTSLLFPVTKLEELTRFPADMVEALDQGESVTLSDGRVVTLQELLEMSRKDLIAERKQVTGQNQELTEQLALAEATNQELKNQLEVIGNSNLTVERMNKMEKELNELKGRQIAIEDAQKALHESEKQLQAIFKLLEAIPVDDVEIQPMYRTALEAARDRINHILASKGLSVHSKILREES